MLSLREKCPNTELFLVRIFPHSDTFHAVSSLLIKYFIFANIFFFINTKIVVSRPNVKVNQLPSIHLIFQNFSYLIMNLSDNFKTKITIRNNLQSLKIYIFQVNQTVTYCAWRRNCY